MYIEKIRAAQQEMEEEILAAVNSHIGAFRRKTGMCPERIDISLEDVTRIEERERNYIADQVSCTIRL